MRQTRNCRQASARGEHLGKRICSLEASGADLPARHGSPSGGAILAAVAAGCFASPSGDVRLTAERADSPAGCHVPCAFRVATGHLAADVPAVLLPEKTLDCPTFDTILRCHPTPTYLTGHAAAASLEYVAILGARDDLCLCGRFCSYVQGASGFEAGNAPLMGAPGKRSRYLVLGPLTRHAGQSNVEPIVGLLVATGGVALEGDPDPIEAAPRKAAGEPRVAI